MSRTEQDRSNTEISQVKNGQIKKSQIKKGMIEGSQQIAEEHESLDRERIKIQLQIMVLKIDKKINRVVNNILHHPRFQELEANWRGLYFLCCERSF